MPRFDGFKGVQSVGNYDSANDTMPSVTNTGAAILQDTPNNVSLGLCPTPFTSVDSLRTLPKPFTDVEPRKHLICSTGGQPGAHRVTTTRSASL